MSVDSCRNRVTIRPFEEQDRPACRALWAELTRSHRALSTTTRRSVVTRPGLGFDAYLGEFAGARKWVAERAEHSDRLRRADHPRRSRSREREVEPVVVSLLRRARARHRPVSLVADGRRRGPRRGGRRPVAQRRVARNSHRRSTSSTRSASRALGRRRPARWTRAIRPCWTGEARRATRRHGRDFDDLIRAQLAVRGRRRFPSGSVHVDDPHLAVHPE